MAPRLTSGTPGSGFRSVGCHVCSRPLVTASDTRRRVWGGASGLRAAGPRRRSTPSPPPAEYRPPAFAARVASSLRPLQAWAQQFVQADAASQRGLTQVLDALMSARSRLQALLCMSLLSGSGAASACTCSLNDPGLVSYSDIFVGRVEAIELAPASFEPWLEDNRRGALRVLAGPQARRPRAPNLAAIRVTEAFTGNRGPLVRVATHSRAASCGFWFQRGETYLVFARRHPQGHLTTDVCTPTAPVRERIELLRSLRSRGRASNNSSKPTPLRGAA